MTDDANFLRAIARSLAYPSAGGDVQRLEAIAARLEAITPMPRPDASVLGDVLVREKATKLANLSAFLAVIGWSEGTDREADPYRVCYGYRHTITGADRVAGTFDDFADHPAVTGEWKGEKLPDDYCRAAGFSPGCVSTAAGRFQFTKPTWLDLKTRLGLRDFSPASQDAACIEKVRQCGALMLVEEGRLTAALALCRRTWASLPGSGWGQPERKLETLVSVFREKGGAPINAMGEPL